MKKYFCKCCGELIIGKNNYVRKYCSSSCKYFDNKDKPTNYQKYKNKLKLRIRKFNPTEINCKSCNNIFMKKSSQQIYCSPECQKEDYNQKIGYRGLLKIRFEIFKRDNFQCQYCGRTPKKDKCKLVIDHILPKARGGNNEVSNLIISCEECNSGKTDILLEERELNRNIVKNE